jgi:phosphoribosyl 1,2-cyclic phosphate phosphodiesterase
MTSIEPGKPFSINGIQITPIGLNHGNLPILGYRIGDVAYLTDVNDIPHESEHQLLGLNYLILDALHRKLHHSHFNLDQAIAWAKRINAKHTYFIHMSHYMGKHEEVERELPESIYLSYDGLRIPVNI